MSEETPVTGNIIRLAIVVEAGILLIAVIFGWFIHRPPLRLIEVSWLAVVMGTAATVPLVIVMWACARSSFGPLRQLMRQVEHQIVPLFAGASSRALFLVSVLAGLGEECLFRGIFQPVMSDWVGVPIALVLTSGLFGLAHLVTPTYAVLAGMIGAYLGTAAIVTDNLLVPVIVHALYDFAALKFLLSPNRRRVAG